MPGQFIQSSLRSNWRTGKMFGNTQGMPKPMALDDSAIASGSLDSMMALTSADEEPFTVLVGYNLGRMTWAVDVTLAKLIEWSSVANDPEKGEVAQRPLDMNHARGLAVYMLKGLVNAAMARRHLQGKPIPEIFESVLHQLGSQPYFSLQPTSNPIARRSARSESPLPIMRPAVFRFTFRGITVGG
jgi:hypothetical protein